LIDASKEVGLKVSEVYMVLSCEQNTQTNQEINIANKSFENVVQFKYLGARVTNENSLRRKLRRD
jgi:ribosomal protein L10